jgi:hypothetical protein
MVPRTAGYAYDVGVWDSSIIQGHSLSRRAKPKLSHDSQLLHRCMQGGELGHDSCEDARAALDLALLKVRFKDPNETPQWVLRSLIETN